MLAGFLPSVRSEADVEDPALPTADRKRLFSGTPPWQSFCLPSNTTKCAGEVQCHTSFLGSGDWNW